MAIYQHKQDLNGQPIKEWCPEDGGCSPEFSVYRLRLSYEEADVGERWVDRFAAFLDAAETDKVTGLVVGAWSDIFDNTDEVDNIVQALVVARERLTNLNAIFFGDVVMEECEISWIALTDLSPLLHAYPNLTYFGVRGANGLSLGSLRHEKLQTLVIESADLDVQVIREVAGAYLPALEHLELWLGSAEGGTNFTIDDLKPIFTGEGFPRLKYLGLRNSHIADDIAVALANSPIIEQLDVLDLSLGTLSDRGAAALLTNPAVAQLQKLNLQYHYCSEEMMERLQMLGIKVDLSEPEGDDVPEDYRFVAVGE